MSLGTLVGGKLILVSRYAADTYHPLGPSRAVYHAINGQSHREFVPSIEVRFENHVWRGDDRAIATALVDGPYFELSQNFLVDSECLPDVVRPRWPFLHRENRRAVLLGLIEGKEPEDALQLVDEKLEAVKKAREKAGAPERPEMKCPECGKPAKGRDPRADIIAHMAMMHPGVEFNG